MGGFITFFSANYAIITAKFRQEGGDIVCRESL